MNILPQKKWNVYNYANRLKVEEDERSHNLYLSKLSDSRALSNLSSLYTSLSSRHSEGVKPNPSSWVSVEDSSKGSGLEEHQTLGSTLKKRLNRWYMQSRDTPFTKKKLNMDCKVQQNLNKVKHNKVKHSYSENREEKKKRMREEMNRRMKEEELREEELRKGK